MSEKEEIPAEAANPRRRFFKTVGALGSGLATALTGWKVLESASERLEAAPIPPPLADSTGNVIVRMQQDLEQTIAQGRTPSWLMVVDTRKCIGCNACTVACRAENPSGPAGAFRRVIERDQGPSWGPWAVFKPFNCLQCDDPPCARAVPAGMIRKRPDGIVEFDASKLRGPYAQAAVQACPVRAAHVDDGRGFTDDTPAPQAYERRTFVENGKVWSRKPRENLLADTARKCTFCSHLLDVGVLPACVTTCIGGAMYFGDANNPNSLVHEITQGRRIFQGHRHLGLKPRVIYFEEPMPEAPHIDCGVCHY